MTGQIRPEFELVWDFMPVLITCKFDGDLIQGNWEPEDHWSCIAYLSAEDMLKSVVIEEKK